MLASLLRGSSSHLVEKDILDKVLSLLGPSPDQRRSASKASQAMHCPHWRFISVPFVEEVHHSRALIGPCLHPHCLHVPQTEFRRTGFGKLSFPPVTISFSRTLCAADPLSLIDDD